MGFHNNFAIIDLYKMLNIFKVNFSILLNVLLYKVFAVEIFWDW